MALPDSVLLVDDESHIRLFIKLILRQMGIKKLYEADNGEAAVEHYKQFKPDVVIMDINMPGKDGLEALDEIMDFDEDAIVFMLTAQASRQMIERSGERGASQYIRKDTPKEEISRILKETFDEIFED